MSDSPAILTPGPVAVPGFILEAIGKPVIHQRSAAFMDFFGALQADLQYFFQTSNPVLTLTGSGSFAVECAMRSFFKAGDQVAVVAMGKFSQRWLTYGKAIGLEVIPMQIPWGETLSPEAALELAKAFPGIKGMVLTHCETSTGVAIDLEEISFALKQYRPELLLVVDAMSTVGALPLYMNAWQLDVVVTSAQKALFNPAGTAFVALSAWAVANLEIPASDDALHLGHYWKYLSQGSFPFTPPTQLLYGVARALQEVRREGLPARWNRCQQLSRLFKEGVESMGGELFGLSNAHNMTAFSFGKHEQDQLRADLFAAGFELAGGQEGLKNKIMRIGHFGWVDEAVHKGCLAALEKLISKN